MKPHELRYIVVAMALSVGVAFAVSALLGPWGFVLYLAAFYVAYRSSKWLHEAIEKIANGREQKK